MRDYLASAAAGYLVGSVSSTRVLARFVAPGEDLSTTEYRIDENGTIVSHGVSPSALGARAGGAWGGLAAVMDIAKASSVTMLVSRVAQGSTSRRLACVAGSAVVVGHAFPVFYGLSGGFGQSPITGAALALDWVSMPTTTVAGLVLGVGVGDSLVALEGWPALMVPFALWRRDRALLGWALAVNAVYWVRMAPEARQRLAHVRRHHPPWRRRVSEIFEGYL
jgi:glycerol-3-phosphate acyltransferase PlsY